MDTDNASQTTKWHTLVDLKMAMVMAMVIDMEMVMVAAMQLR